MSKDKEKKQFKKSIKLDSYTNTKNPNYHNKIINQRRIKNKEILKQRKKAKEELVFKYNMSETEAEKTLRNIEQKVIHKQNKTSSRINKKKNNSDINIEQNLYEDEYEVIIPQHVHPVENKYDNSVSETKNKNKFYKTKEEIKLTENTKSKTVVSKKEKNIKNNIKNENVHLQQGKKEENYPKQQTKNENTTKKDKQEKNTETKEEINFSKIYQKDNEKNEKIDLNSIYLKTEDEEKKYYEEDKNIENGEEVNILTPSVLEKQIFSVDKKEESKINAKSNKKTVEKNEKTHNNRANKKEKISSKKPEKRENRNTDIDEIISDLISNSEEQISVEVKNISLSYDMEKDKIDNLKEYFIRTIKRNKDTKTKFQALKNVSFKVYKGEKVGIIGYNGAGKSTLLKVITGIYYPDEGEVNVNGKISPLLGLGSGLDPNYSGRENIYLNGAVLGYEKSFIDGKYDEIVEFSELGEFIEYPIKNYSNGMLAKLVFSIATIVDPDILIIDEILSVGDVNFARKSGDKMKSLMDGKTTVLLVSHSINQIRSLCDKAIWIDKGELREMGEVNKVCDNYLKDAEKATQEQLMNIKLR